MQEFYTILFLMSWISLAGFIFFLLTVARIGKLVLTKKFIPIKSTPFYAYSRPLHFSQLPLKICAYITIILLMFSCKKETGVNWDADIMSPVAKSTLTLNKLFPDSIIKNGQDSVLRMAFETKLFEFNTAQFTSLIRDTTIKYNFMFSLPGYIEYLPGQEIYSFQNQEMKLDVTDVEFTQMKLRSGKINLHVENGIRQPMIYQYSFPKTTKNNIPLVLNISAPKGTFLSNGQIIPGVADTTIDLSNYDFDLRGFNANTVNVLSYSTKIIADPSGQKDSLKNGQYLSSTCTFKSLVPEYIEGYFGSNSIVVGPDNFHFDLFRQMHSGIFNLDQANIEMKLVNELGVDMIGQIAQLTSINSSSGNGVQLSGGNIGQQFTLSSAQKTGIPANPVSPSYKSFMINGSNSNIVNFINNMPDKISYFLMGKLNPMGNVSGYNDFVYNGKSLYGLFKADIPLIFSANNISLRDTVNVNFQNETQLNHINNGYLVLHAKNTFPLDVHIQGYLLDENNKVLETLFETPNLVSAAPVDNNLKVSSPRTSILRIPLDKNKIELLKTAKRVAFTTRFSTNPQPQKIKFYSHYKIDLNLVADVNANISKP